MTIPEHPVLHQLEQEDFLSYGCAIVGVVEVIINHFEINRKITRDGLMESNAIDRKTWDHCLKFPGGILWEAKIVKSNKDGVTVIQPHVWKHLLDWFKLKVSNIDITEHEKIRKGFLDKQEERIEQHNEVTSFQEDSTIPEEETPEMNFYVVK